MKGESEEISEDSIVTKPKPCKYCAEGRKANERGEHWIVKSISPAKIDIRKCIEALKTPPTGKQGHGFNSYRTANPMYAPLSEKDGETLPARWQKNSGL